MKARIFVLWVVVSLLGLARVLALAPSTVGGVVASAGKLSNTIKETTAWKTLTSHPNSLVRIIPARAMEVVQDVFRSLRVRDLIRIIGAKMRITWPTSTMSEWSPLFGRPRKYPRGKHETRVIVDTPLGRLRGRIQAYKSGIIGAYYSFRGIRYGLPPIGLRRFRAALPEPPWTGVRDALKEGSNCPHKNMILDTFKGSEDCLYLNIFTNTLPKGSSNPRLPVMVWFHGGGYSFGSGNTFLYGPDYLVAENVVLVTLNYRLGPLGFLSVSPDAPGNSGLKDQALALKWIKDNIASFGGDPNKVTIFGESAGGSSVQFHMLSPMSKGLFHYAISESGSALNPWAQSQNPRERAFHLGRLLGVYTNSTEDLLDKLRQVPARKLIENAPHTITAEDLRRNIGLPFVPTIEGKWDESNNINGSQLFLEEPFITEDPISLYKQGKFYQVPYIAGYNSHEAMLFIRRLRKNPLLLEIINRDFVRLVPPDLQLNGDHSKLAEDVSKKMKNFYLGSRPVDRDTIEEMIYLFTDLMFLRGITRTVRMHATFGKVPVYMYRFGFDGSLGLYKRMLGIARPGVCHGDELGYLFHFGFFNLSLDSMAPEILVKRRMVKMWTNFAKYGDPTPLGRNDTILSVKWDPIDGQNITRSINYLDITTSLESRVNPESHRLQFWDAMYKEHNGDEM